MNRSKPPRSTGSHRTSGPGAGIHQADPERDPDQLVDPGRPLGLRVLALVGAFSFLMLGLSVLAPLLQPRPPLPRPLPGTTTDTTT